MVIRIILFVLAALLGLGAVVFMVRAFGARLLASKKVFGVERQSEHQRMKQYTLAGIGLFIMALLFVGLGSLFGGNGEVTASEEQAPESIPDQGVEIPLGETPTQLLEVTSTVVPPTLTVAPVLVSTSAPADTAEPSTSQPSPTFVPTEAPTATPVVETALVNSPVVGLYLRSTPGGEILERLEDQTQIILLEGEQIVEELTWVEVQAPSGNVGWVAVDFLDLTSSSEGG